VCRVNVWILGLQTHFRALFRKRFRFAKRDKKAICFQLVIPVIALLIGLGLLKSVNIQSPPAHRLSVADYNKIGGSRLPLDLPFWANNPLEGVGLMQYISQQNGAIVPDAQMNVTKAFVEPSGYQCSADTYNKFDPVYLYTEVSRRIVHVALFPC
jgi:hypothetical protein